MVKAPTVVGLIFCDRLVPDLDTGQVSLRGIVNQIEVFDFSEPHPLTVYALLAGGRGEGRLELKVYELGDHAIHRIFRVTHWARFVAEPNFRNLELRLRTLRFHHARPHLMQLRFEEVLITERRFVVLDGRKS